MELHFLKIYIIPFYLLYLLIFRRLHIFFLLNKVFLRCVLILIKHLCFEDLSNQSIELQNYRLEDMN